MWGVYGEQAPWSIGLATLAGAFLLNTVESVFNPFASSARNCCLRTNKTSLPKIENPVVLMVELEA